MSIQRKTQATADIVIPFPIIKKDGTQGTVAGGVTLASLSAKIIGPDGLAVTGFTAPAFTEPGADGSFVAIFASNAAVKAFTLADQANPYFVTFDSSVADYEPTGPKPVWIVSKYPWELAKPSEILVDPATDKIDGSLIDISVNSRASQTSLDKEIAKLFALIEFQRGNHTGEGNMYHVDPVNGNDANDGLTKETSKLTWDGVNALVVAHRHDIILIHTANNGAPTVWYTFIDMNKAFTFVRSVGRDMTIIAPDGTDDTIKLTAVGCELSGCIAKTHTTGNRDAIKITADFYKLKKVWVDFSRGHGVAIENASHGLVDELVVQDAAAGGSGHAVSIKSTSGNSRRNFFKNIKILNNAGDGFRFDGANTNNNILVAGESGSLIYGNTEYGINELNGADHNHVMGPILHIHNNTSGNINLTGPDSQALNIEQWAKETTQIAEHDATQALINEKVTGSVSIQVVSATSGSVVVSAVKAGGTFQFVRGNEISYPYGPLGKDVTGRKIYFAVKKKASDAAYVISFTEITANLTNATTFTGLVPFTAAMTKDLAKGQYYLAINSYAADDTTFVKPLTEATFVLDLVDRIIDNP